MRISTVSSPHINGHSHQKINQVEARVECAIPQDRPRPRSAWRLRSSRLKYDAASRTSGTYVCCRLNRGLSVASPDEWRKKVWRFSPTELAPPIGVSLRSRGQNTTHMHVIDIDDDNQSCLRKDVLNEQTSGTKEEYTNSSLQDYPLLLESSA